MLALAAVALARRSGKPLQPLSQSTPAATTHVTLKKPNFMDASLRARDETLVNDYPVMPVFVTNKPQTALSPQALHRFNKGGADGRRDVVHL